MRVILAIIATLLIGSQAPVTQLNNQHQAEFPPQPTAVVQATESVAPLPEAEIVVETAQETMRKGCELAYNYDWPQQTAYAICMAESTNDPNADNFDDVHRNADGSVICVGSFSLWQVGCFWYYHFGYSESDFYNPDVNVEIAYQIYIRQGSFNAWTTYTRGSYLKYM